MLKQFDLTNLNEENSPFVNLEDKIKKLSKYYILFFGEKYKNHIVKRLSNTIYVCCLERDSTAKNEKLIARVKKNALKQYFADLKLDIDVDKKSLKELEEYLKQHKINLYGKYADLYNSIDYACDYKRRDYIDVSKLNQQIIKLNLGKYFSKFNIDDKSLDFDILEGFVMKDYTYVAEWEKLKCQKILNDIFKTNFTLEQLESNSEYSELIKQFKSEMKEQLDWSDKLAIKGLREWKDQDDVKSRELINYIATLLYDEDYDNYFDYFFGYQSANSNYEALALNYANTDANTCIVSSNCASLTFVHELLHIISSYGKKDGKYIKKSGFLIDGKKNWEFNEIITDYFAVDINNKMLKNNFKMANGVEKESFYSNFFSLLEDFIYNYNDLIKDAYLGDSIDSFVEVIGEKNFQKLNDVLKDLFDFCKFKPNETEFNNAVKEYKRTGVIPTLNVNGYLGESDYRFLASIDKIKELEQVLEKIDEHAKIVGYFANNDNV